MEAVCHLVIDEMFLVCIYKDTGARERGALSSLLLLFLIVANVHTVSMAAKHSKIL